MTGDYHEMIVIGAGAAGLMSARELSRSGCKVIVLEARERIGGRIWTVHPPSPLQGGNWFELGAEFIHWEAETTFKLLKEYGISYSPARGNIRRVSGGEPAKEQLSLIGKKLSGLKRDIPLKKFLDKYFSGEKFSGLRKMVSNFAEGFESADIERYSTFDFREDWLESGKWEQHRVDGGYGKLMEAIAEDCRKNGCEIIFGINVKEISHAKTQRQQRVRIVSERGEMFYGDKALITLPLSIYQQGAIKFSPALPKKIDAAKKLGFGYVIKLLLLFKEKFWEKPTPPFGHPSPEGTNGVFMILSDEAVPTWWTQNHPPNPLQREIKENFPLLTGWLSGSKAKERTSSTDEEIFQIGLRSLSKIFKIDEKILREKVAEWRVANWNKDEFSRGSYNYATVGAEKYIKILGRTVDKTLYFAGEIFAGGRSTVEAALASGIKVAERVLRVR